jgi:hypothetical protein
VVPAERVDVVLSTPHCRLRTIHRAVAALSEDQGGASAVSPRGTGAGAAAAAAADATAADAAAAAADTIDKAAGAGFDTAGRAAAVPAAAK